MKRVLGWFESKADADNAASDLIKQNFPREMVHMGHGRELLSGTGPSADEPGGLRKFLMEIGFISEEKDKPHHRQIRDEDVMVAVDAEESRVDEAVSVINRHGPIDIDKRAAGLGATAATGVPREAKGERVSTAETRSTVGTTGEEVTVPVVEEELKAGKREIRHGSVRVYTHPTERPVEEDIHLHEEKVHVERHPVDRPASGADMAAFKEGSMEFTERSEEPVVSKEARVKEEVTIGKESRERTERIHETLHGTEVEVERLSPEEERDFSAIEPELRSTTAPVSGSRYEDLRPMYRYGYHLGRTPRYQRDWSSVEPEIRRDWESRHPEPWERSKSAIRTGWERAVHHH